MHRIDALVAARPLSSERYQRACATPPGSGEYALVLASGELAVGFALMAQVLDEVTILNIALEPAARGRGLGRQLLVAALALACENGARRCLLEVRDSNIVARALYEREGFSLDGVRKGYYPVDAGREDALLMSKEL